MARAAKRPVSAPAPAPVTRGGRFTARQWEALPQGERRSRAHERPAYHRPFAPPGGGLWRPAMEVTDARGLTLYACTIPAEEIPNVLRFLVETYLG